MYDSIISFVFLWYQWRLVWLSLKHLSKFFKWLIKIFAQFCLHLLIWKIYISKVVYRSIHGSLNKLLDKFSPCVTLANLLFINKYISLNTLLVFYLNILLSQKISNFFHPSFPKIWTFSLKILPPLLDHHHHQNPKLETQRKKLKSTKIPMSKH